MNKTNVHIILKRTLILFVPFLVLIISVSLIITNTKNRSEQELFRGIEKNSADIAVKKIEKELFHVLSDLTILSSLNELESYLENNKNKEQLRDLKNYFISLLANRKVYDQARLIDSTGWELIRANYNNGEPVIVPDKDLQNKKDRYYFNEAFSLKYGEVFVSQLDLNIEHGIIEQPFKPVIRFATPVFDKNGNKKGIILLNFLGYQIVNFYPSKNEKTVENQIMLLNSESYWLKGLSPDQEWGFMFDDKKDVKFSKLYPQEWKIIIDQEESQIETENGLFTFLTIYPVPQGLVSKNNSRTKSDKKIKSQDHFWKIISFVPKDTLYSQQKSRNRLAISIIVILASISFFTSWQVSKTSYLRKVANLELVENEKKLKQLNAEKDKFFSIIAHDLKNPFTTLISFSKLLENNIDKYDMEKKKHIISMISKGLNNAYKLLENLLYWSRSQRGVIDFNPQKLDLFLLTEEIYNLLSNSAEIKSINLINTVPEKFSIVADKDTISTVIRNLVSNAIKFTPKGGEIIISAKYQTDNSGNDLAEVVVKDNGVGIPEEIKAGLFEINTNISSSGTENETGTGLGLILCKEFVEKHNGKIWVESEIEKGSSFYFTIPNKISS